MADEQKEVKEPETTSKDETEENDEGEVITITPKYFSECNEMEDELMEDAAALLGAANDKACSYSEGYLKRQALYSCLTCIPEAKLDHEKAVGVCLGCSYHCHDDHELIELYTKRNFRCDCGNKKFSNSGNKCSLNDQKSDTNDLNSYNQNFSGMYCVCHRPFPDMEDPVPDEMIQCIICEDWFHSRHLGSEVPPNFAEMTCQICIAKHEFFLHYDHLTASSAAKTEENVDVEDVEKKDEAKIETVSADCKKSATKSDKVTAKFWSDPSWRKQLCTCDSCLKTYEDEDVAFLLDPEDPVHLFEERGKAKYKALVEDNNKKFINSIDRVTMVEFLTKFNEFKEELGEFIGKFAADNKVIRETDVREFFEGMQARKKAKLDVHVPYHCR